MKKKIMHIVQSPGGVERYIIMFLKNMDSSRYENILVCSYDFKEENYKGILTAFEHVDMTRDINVKSDFNAVLRIRKLIKKYKPDIIYMHSSKGGAIGRIANIGMKNYSIYNPHGWAFNMDCGYKKKVIYRWIEKLLVPLCNVIVAISDSEKQSAVENKICKSNKMKVIYNGIDIMDYENRKKSYSLTRESLFIPSDKYIIGTVGRLSKQKAPDTFIKAASIIKNKIPNAFFIMVGDGDMQEQIGNLITLAGLQDSVLITGWVNEPMEYINIFDQAMLLSRWEGFGLVLAEYMISEKPIVATNVDAIPNIIKNGKNGLLVKMDDIDAIAQASIEIKDNQELRDSMVHEGLNIVYNNFDIKRLVSEFDKLFKEKE